MREANAIQTLHASRRVMCVVGGGQGLGGVAARGVRGEGGRG